MTSPRYLQQNQLEDCKKPTLLVEKYSKKTPGDVNACCLL